MIRIVYVWVAYGSIPIIVLYKAEQSFGSQLKMFIIIETNTYLLKTEEIEAEINIL